MTLDDAIKMMALPAFQEALGNPQASYPVYADIFPRWCPGLGWLWIGVGGLCRQRTRETNVHAAMRFVLQSLQTKAKELP